MRKQKWGCDEKNLSTRSEINLGAFYMFLSTFVSKLIHLVQINCVLPELFRYDSLKHASFEFQIRKKVRDTGLLSFQFDSNLRRYCEGNDVGLGDH